MSARKVETVKTTCPHCGEEDTRLLVNGEPDIRQVPHCIECAICKKIKRPSEGRVKVSKLPGTPYHVFYCSECNGE